MASEAVVYPQDLFSYMYKDFYNSIAGPDWDFHEDNSVFSDKFRALNDTNEDNNNNNNVIINHIIEGSSLLQYDTSSSTTTTTATIMQQELVNWGTIANSHCSSSPDQEANCTFDQSALQPGGMMFPGATTGTATTGRRKRRRTRNVKNKEEIEKQRMTHIAVERNRRKQMNDYLSILRSLMPPSYAQRIDQASIIGGAINYVKELEQLLQTLEANKKTTMPNMTTRPFSQFFTFPQYSTSTHQSCTSTAEIVADHHRAAAEIEVTMVENHANIKILSVRRPRQLLKLVVGLHGLSLCVLHLNVASLDQMVLYSLSVKVEEGCHLNTVDEIAAAVNQLLHMIQDEAAYNLISPNN